MPKCLFGTSGGLLLGLACYIEQENLLDVGDIEEALYRSLCIGDDTLQEQAYIILCLIAFTFIRNVFGSNVLPIRRF